MSKNRYVLILLLTLSLGLAFSGIARQKADETAVDPVCGMTVKKAEAKATFDYKGTTYYFCSSGCQEAFVKDPEKHLQKKEEATAGQSMSHGRMAGKCPMMQGQHQPGQMAGSAVGMSCPFMSKDVEMKTEILPDGVAIKITSKNPEVVKKIQEHSDQQKGCCCAGCLEHRQSVDK